MNTALIVLGCISISVVTCANIPIPGTSMELIPIGSNKRSGNSYYISSGPARGDVALTSCASLPGMYLLSINNQFEQDTVVGMLRNYGISQNIWLSARCNAATQEWVWADNTVISPIFHKFANFDGNFCSITGDAQNQVQMYSYGVMSRAFTWEPVLIGTPNRFICESF